MARYQRGGVSREKRKHVDVWVFRYYKTRPSDGKRTQTTCVIGTVQEFKTASDALREVARRGLEQKINQETLGRLKPPMFRELADAFLDTELQDKSRNYSYLLKHNLESYVLPRWGKRTAPQITPHEIKLWLKSLRDDKRLAAPTVAKIRNAMSLVYSNAGAINLIPLGMNPVSAVRVSGKTDYRAIILTPAQSYEMAMSLEEPVRTLTILVAATGLRISEAVGLKWLDVFWEKRLIYIRRTWSQGAMGSVKTERSGAPVPLCADLADFLRAWQAETPYSGSGDWIFASDRCQGKRPREASVMAQDYLRPLAVSAGLLKEGDTRTRFGWHNFRHSLASYLIDQRESNKTVQDLLRHSHVQTTLNLYAQSMDDSRLAAQSKMFAAMRGSVHQEI